MSSSSLVVNAGFARKKPDLVQKVLKGQDPLHILGDGTQIRHYTYGGDLARGIVAAMEHPDALNDDFMSVDLRPWDADLIYNFYQALSFFLYSLTTL